MKESEKITTSRRDVLKTGALGVGVLAAAISEPAAAAPVPPPPATAPTFDYFLKLEGIEGDATDKFYKGNIELLSFAWGAERPAPATGRAQVFDFAFTARTGKASPRVFQALVENKVVKTADVTVVRRTQPNTPFFKLRFTDLLVTSYDVASDSKGGAPLDTGSVAYRKVEYSFYPQAPGTGQPQPPVTAIWERPE